MCSRASWKRLIDPASMAESVKAGSLTCTTNGEGRSTEKNLKGANEKIRKYAAENGIAGRLK